MEEIDAGSMLAVAAMRYTVWAGRYRDRTLSKASLIAIVDDDQSVRQALSALIRSLGYGVVTFPCAEELLGSERREEIACLISDVQMPGMNGLELHQRLTAEKKSVPTILITAYPNERSQQRAHDAGVNCYLVKPFNEDELIACLRTALGERM